MDDRLAALMCRGSQGPPVLHARADAYHDGTRFHLLELNAGSELGGTDTAQQNRAWLRVPEFAAFADGAVIEFGYEYDVLGRLQEPVAHALDPETFLHTHAALDLALVLGRPSAFEYVLVHELCHLIQPNHSPAFWHEVEQRFPAWREQRDYFQLEGRRLKAMLRQLL